MAEYIFEGDVIIDGVRYKHDQMRTTVDSGDHPLEHAKSNLEWRVRKEYDLTNKLWVDVHIEGTLCTVEEYNKAYFRDIKFKMNKLYGKNVVPDLPDSAKKGAEQIAFPIDELIKK